MRPGVRRFALVAHVTCSVGWLGTVATFLAMAIVGAASSDEQTARGVYLVLDRVAWFTLVPLAAGTLITGVIQSLATQWGLFRHYWVLFKLVITAVATVVLLQYMPTFAAMAGIAADADTTLTEIRNPSPVLHAALALAGLFAANVLAVYKPRGLTPFGERHRSPARATPAGQKGRRPRHCR